MKYIFLVMGIGCLSTASMVFSRLPKFDLENKSNNRKRTTGIIIGIINIFFSLAGFAFYALLDYIS